MGQTILCIMDHIKTLPSENVFIKNHHLDFIPQINRWIKTQEENAIGISIILIMIGTMIASISVALAIHKEIAYIPLIFSCFSAMGANAIAISQRPFKVVIWAFLINIIGNIACIIYQLI